MEQSAVIGPFSGKRNLSVAPGPFKFYCDCFLKKFLEQSLTFVKGVGSEHIPGPGDG